MTDEDKPSVLYLRRVPKSLKRRLRIEAARRARPINEYTIDLLTRAVEREEREKVIVK